MWDATFLSVLCTCILYKSRQDDILVRYVATFFFQAGKTTTSAPPPQVCASIRVTTELRRVDGVAAQHRTFRWTLFKRIFFLRDTQKKKQSMW
jgi:hypothetical protein